MFLNKSIYIFINSNELLVYLFIYSHFLLINDTFNYLIKSVFIYVILSLLTLN